VSSEEQVESEVQKWLTKTGFPLEMRVAREARRVRGLWVQQSPYFIDPETGQVRETDVVVGLGPDTRTQYSNVVLVVECKAKPVPWIVFDDGDLPTDDAMRRMDLAVRAAPRNEYGDGLSMRIKQNAFTGDTLLRPSRIGFGIIAKEEPQKGQPRNSAWDAVRSVVSAAHGLAPEFDSRAIDNGDLPLLLVPVVVTSGKLMRAYLSGDDVAVESVGQAEVVVRTTSPKAQVRCLVVREEAWPKVLQDAQATTQVFDISD